LEMIFSTKHIHTDAVAFSFAARQLLQRYGSVLWAFG
jgi:hypothetical protein